MAETTMSDGRLARRERNRLAVIDAVVEMSMEGLDDPSFHEVADRAGVSFRSVYRYFDDRDELRTAAVERTMEWLQPMLVHESGPAEPGDPLDHRLDALVDARVELYVNVADTVRAALAYATKEPSLATQVEKARRMLRGQVLLRFAAELAEFSDVERELRLTSIELALDYSTLDYVMRRRQHNREELERYLRGAIRAALTVAEVGT